MLDFTGENRRIYYEILKEPRGWPDWTIKVNGEIIYIELKRQGDKIDKVRQYPIFRRLLKSNQKIYLISYQKKEGNEYIIKEPIRLTLNSLERY